MYAFCVVKRSENLIDQIIRNIAINQISKIKILCKAELSIKQIMHNAYTVKCSFIYSII